MKRIIFMMLIVAIGVMPLAGAIEKGNSSDDQLNLTCTTTDYNVIEINVMGESYNKIITAGIESLLPGDPDLPTQAVWIAIPAGKQAILQVRSIETEKVNIRDLAPVAQPAVETKGAPAPQYVRNEKIYGSGEIFPGKLAELEKESDYRGQSCAVVRFYPYQYNPVSGELVIHHHIELDISFTGSGTGLAGKMYNPQMQEFIENNMINGREILSATAIMEDRAETRDGGCDLLLFCPEIFVAAAEELADWKAKKGIKVEVVSTETAGESCFEIGAYINQYCENNDPCPQSIMLFGDAEFIPPWYVHEFPGEGMIATDIYYADLEMEFDFLLDFTFGRVPVDTVEDAQRFVNNLIAYEQTPPANPQYYQKALIAGAFQDGASEPPDTYANRRFAKTSEDVRNFLTEEGYDAQRVYTEYNGYNSSEIFPTYWNQNNFIFENDIPGEELPLELQKPQFPWNGTESDVAAILNSGCFLMTHRDHGGRTGWGEPDFNSDDVTQLSNGELLPVVWSINCLTGYFDNETDGAGTGINNECFTERWFRNPAGGAIGVVASTRISYSGNNDRFVWGMMDAIWEPFLEWCGADYPNNNSVFRMGDVVNYGKTYLTLNSTYEDYLFISFEEFEWFGDPTMEIWVQQPEQFIVEHTADLEYGNSEYSVDTGRPGAYCSLWDGEQVIAEAVAGLDNIANLVLGEYNFVDELILTVSYSQYEPYTAEIDILPPQSGFLELNNLLLDDTSGNSNGLADYGETILIGLELTNIGAEVFDGFSMTLSCDSQYISITDDSYEYTGTIDPLESEEIAAMFELSIAENCPDAELAMLQFSFAGNILHEELILHAPRLSSGYFMINDEAGNNNQAADPGEELILSLNVQNNGSAAAEDVSILLLSYDPNLTITPAEIVLESLLGEVTVEFNGSVTETAPIGSDFDLQVFINSGAYNFDRLMSGNYGYAVEDFESADFSLYNWQMSGDNNWVIDAESVSGIYSARTELMSINSRAVLSIPGFLAEDGVIGFYRKLYANTALPGNNGGILAFYIDNEEIDSWGGNSSWQFVQFEVAAGPHEFSWEFEKDNDPTTGTDGAWLDRIEFPSMTTPPPPEMTIEAEEIVIEVPANSELESSFTISNSGAGILEYIVFHQTGDRDLADTHVSMSTYNYAPGQTSGWLVSLHNSENSDEGIIDLYLSFPPEINVNIATPLNGGTGGSLIPDGTTGGGVTVNWHGETEDGYGVLLAGETGMGAVNVTIAEETPLTLILDAQIIGDNGTELNQQIELGNLINSWLTMSDNTGSLGYGESAEIGLTINTAGMAEGSYTENLRVTDNLGTEVILPVILNVTAAAEEPAEIITVTALQNIYPNPFNPQTTISFSLEEAEQVEIAIYNIKGQQVEILVNEVRDSGTQSVIWQADTYSSGVYFVQMKASGYHKTSKLLLLK